MALNTVIFACILFTAMRTRHTFLVLTSGGLLSAAVAGAVIAARRGRRSGAYLGTWHLCEADILFDLGRLV